MCGILGKINSNQPVDEALFTKMRDTLAHRGPDGAGLYFSNDKMVALGHRRLALIDLSENGKQPMCNEDQSIWLTCNGEIYNYRELRIQLRSYGHTFHSESDSEVIVHGYEQWGTDVVNKLKGMFAFGIWDNAKKQLFLARDRFGIKPLYFYRDARTFLFASEIKAIVFDPGVKREINFTSLCNYFTYRYIPAPDTIWKNIYKIPAAHFLILDAKGNCKTGKYWDLQSSDHSISETDAIEKINFLIEESVKGHILSDVPVGTFLSGGYDSSALVCYQKKIGYPAKTFSIGFENWNKSEHQYAKLVSEIFNTEHQSKIIGHQTLDVIDKLVYFYDEPIADISIIPTYIVSELAGKKVKAVLSGEGADELFCGYTWHKSKTDNLSIQNKLLLLKDKFLKGGKQYNTDEYSEAMAMGYFGQSDLKELLLSDLHPSIPENTKWFYDANYKPDLTSVKKFQYLDIKTFMGELVLTKVDRASMANSLEARVPFLDHEIAEFIFSVSEKIYFREKYTKFLLYENIKKSLPDTIMKRPKQGFVGPDSYYMNYTWYRENILPGKLISDNLIKKETIEKYLLRKDHWRLWKVAVFEKWYSFWNTNKANGC